MMITTFDLLGIRGRGVAVEVTLDPTATSAMVFEGATLSETAEP